jgi:hypothetical protein
MRKTLTIALVALATMIALPGAAQTKKKGGGEPASSKQADPLSSFQQIVKKFNAFFATGPRKLIQKQKFSKSPNGEVIYVMEYTGRDVAYDVQKTTSLVSPYSATINVKLVGRGNGSCGDVRVSNLDKSDTGYGWTTVKDALSASDRSDCFKWYPNASAPDTYDIKFVFAFQDGRWVFKDAVRTAFSDTWTLFMSLVGNATYPVTQFSEPEAQAMNVVWRDLVQN